MDSETHAEVILPHVAEYLDDVIIYSTTWLNHLRHIRTVLKEPWKMRHMACPGKSGADQGTMSRPTKNQKGDLETKGNLKQCLNTLTLLHKSRFVSFWGWQVIIDVSCLTLTH